MKGVILSGAPVATAAGGKDLVRHSERVLLCASREESLRWVNGEMLRRSLHDEAPQHDAHWTAPVSGDLGRVTG